jgi:hypothetical protein
MRPHALPLLGLLLAGPAFAYVTPGPLFQASGQAYKGGFGDVDPLADLNQDGLSDIVFGGFHGFAVALATGAGSFGPYQHFFPGLEFVAPSVGDFDGDGILDVAGATQTSVFVAYGTGLGTFDALFDMPVANLRDWSMAGDLDGNGHTDLVAFTDDSTLVTFLSAPGRTLVQAGSCKLSGDLEGLAIGDVAGNGAADLVVTSYEYNELEIFPGNGDGTFGAPVDVELTGYPVGVALGKFDANQTNDLLVHSSVVGTGVVYISNLGGNAFAPFSPLPSPDIGWDVLIGDYDRDGKLDVLSNSVISGRTGIYTWAGDGAGGFGPRLDSGHVMFYRTKLVQGDIDGDGKLDIGGTNNNVFAFIVSMGNGDGTFGGPPSPAPVAGRIRGAAAGDFDGDGKVDAVGTNDITKKLAFARGRGDGTLDPIVESAPLPLAYTYLASGNFDADPALDLVAVGGSLSFLHGNGDGTFAAPVDYTLGATPAMPEIIDLDGDGKLDVVVPCKGANALYVFHQGVAGLTGPVPSATPTGPVAVRFADLNGDGRLDRALACTNLVVVQLDDGAGGWSTSLSNPLTTPASDVELADIDEDGSRDLLFNEASTVFSPFLHLLRGHPDGSFDGGTTINTDWDPEHPEEAFTHRSLSGVRAIDLDEDGHLDLVGPGGLQVNSLRGNGDGTFRRAESALGAWMSSSFINFGDFDGNGHVDVLGGGATGGLTSFSVFLNRTGGVVGVPAPTGRAAGIALDAPFPNPARSSFVLRYRVPDRTAISVDLVSVTGRRVLSRTASPQAAGEQSLHIDGLDRLAPGVYGVVVSQGDRRATTRLVVLP